MKSSQHRQSDQRRSYADEDKPLAVKPSISNERTQLLAAAFLLVVIVILFIEWQW